MTEIFLSLGSNIQRRENISAALNRLEQQFGSLRTSPVYESEPIGFEGENFYNLIVSLESSLALRDISRCLKKIEDDHGRNRNSPKFSARTMDIDIVLYGEQCGMHDGIELPRPELYYNAFVLLPIAELAPQSVDPKTGKTFQELWVQLKENSESPQKLWQVDF